MNDLVGIITYVRFTETPAVDLNKGATKDEQMYYWLMSEKFFEADIYAIFDKLMKTGHMDMFEHKRSGSKKRRVNNAFTDPLQRSTI